MSSSDRPILLTICAVFACLALWSVAAAPLPQSAPLAPPNRVLPQFGSLSCLDVLREVANAVGAEGEESVANDYSDESNNLMYCNLVIEKNFLDYDLTRYGSFRHTQFWIFSGENLTYQLPDEQTTRMTFSFHGYPALLEIQPAPAPDDD